MVSNASGKRVSEKLSRLIANSLTTGELKIYQKIEKADALSFDAIYLSCLKDFFGFSPEDCKNLFRQVSIRAKEYEDYALSGTPIPLIENLKVWGVNLEQWCKEAALWQSDTTSMK